MSEDRIEGKDVKKLPHREKKEAEDTSSSEIAVQSTPTPSLVVREGKPKKAETGAAAGQKKTKKDDKRKKFYGK